MGIALQSKVLVPKHTRIPNPTAVCQDNERELVTVLECIAADNYVATPCIIFKGKSHNYGWYPANFEGYSYSYGVSDNGWIDIILYYEWLEKIFEPQTRTR